MIIHWGNCGRRTSSEADPDMRRVLILVEGLTEERFVKDVLQSHLWRVGVHPEPKIATTKRVKRGRDFKGGITDFQKVDKDLRRLLGDTGASLVTTLIDYYGLPEDFPGKQTLTGGNPVERARHLERAWEAHYAAGLRFRAFFMVHEFEALLFADPSVLAATMNEPLRVRPLQAIRNSFPTPEDIDDNPATTPSARVSDLFPAYRKGLHGPLVTSRIGLDILRHECPHFHEWVDALETLGQVPNSAGMPDKEPD
jgi:hypothetical protein